MPVGLLLVSHSRDLAQGVAELARQMAQAVPVQAVGGDDAGGLGTSFTAVGAALESVGDEGAVLLYDLGGAGLIAATALELADPRVAARVIMVDAPLVEGAVAAAVAAAGGAGIEEVARAARTAGLATDPPAPAPYLGHSADPAGPPEGAAGGAGPWLTRTVPVINQLGLHARPVAALIRALDGWDAQVRVGRPGTDPVDLRSVLRVVRLALRGGESVQLHAQGRDAVPVLGAMTGLIRTGFGEARGTTRTAPAGMGVAPARLGNAPARARLRTSLLPELRHGLLQAQPGVPGLVLGPLVKLDRAPLHLPPAGPDPGPIEHEQWLLTAAIGRAERKLSAGNEFEAAHAALLADPELAAAAAQRLDAAAETAAVAWWSVVSAQAESLAADRDELVAARAVDLREAGAAVLAELGEAVDRIPAELAGAVVFAHDLGPGEVPVLLERGAAGLILSGSAITAHAVIVARGLGLPLVVRAGSDLAHQPAGVPVLLDGDAGLITVAPDRAVTDAATRRIGAQLRAAGRRADAATAPVRLADGRVIGVLANVGSLADAHAAVRFGADGIGLLRTELLLLDRDTFPDEDTHTHDLAAIFAVTGDRPVTVRVLDAGGDKQVTALHLDQTYHGFLGLRGLRYLLAHPDILRLQLRAVLRAAVGHRMSVMAPMVSVAAEAQAFRGAVLAAADSLRADGLAFAEPERIGVMVEVPAAALAADEICAVSDFISVGSNDLISYLMAADRTVPEVADLLDPSASAVQRTLSQVFAQARAANTPVAVCGEIAGMAEYAPGLVDQGVTELSMAPARIPVIKELLRAGT